MTRKEFLKTVLLILLGGPLLRWLDSISRPTGLKEARFFKSGNHLAG